MNAAALTLDELSRLEGAASQHCNELTDAQLTCCQKGDPKALRHFVLLYQQRIFGFVARMVSGAPVAEDLAQEVFLRAYKALPRYQRRQDTRLSSWLYAIAHRVVIDHARRQGRVQLSSLDPKPIDCHTPEHHRRRSELLQKLARALKELPAEQRAVFVLVQFNHCSMGEAAQALGISVACAKVRLHRARKRLMQMLAEHDGERA